LDAGTVLGTAQPVDMVEPAFDDSEGESASVRSVSGNAKFRIDKLLELVDVSEELGEEDTIRFKEFLVRHHQAFCLEPGERISADGNRHT